MKKKTSSCLLGFEPYDIQKYAFKNLLHKLYAKKTTLSIVEFRKDNKLSKTDGRNKM